MSWLLPSSRSLLIKDINTDLMRLDTDIRVLELTSPDSFEKIMPNVPQSDWDKIDDLLEITYLKDGVQGILLGTLLTPEDHADYEKRHGWTMDIAEALTISH